MINYNGLSKMKDVKDSVSLETLAVLQIIVVFHQVSYLIAFYNQSIDYTIHCLLFRIWKNKSRIGYKKRLVYYFSVN